MSIYFFETNDEQQRYLTERLPGETLHFSPEPLKTASQAHEIAADAEIISPFVHSCVITHQRQELSLKTSCRDF